MNLSENESAGVSADAYIERKSIYQNFEFVDRAYDEETAKEIKANFSFDDGPGANFCSSARNDKKQSAGKNYPYCWQAHHIVPQEVYRGKKESNRVFNDEQAELIEATGYNINHGHNIIFLPGVGATKYVPVHGLAQHVGSHPNYSIVVYEAVSDFKDALVAELDKIKEEIKKAEENKHKGIKVAILKDLRKAEHAMWDEIVEASKESVEALLSNEGELFDIMKERDDWFKLG